MDSKELKTFLAGLGMASLLAGATLMAGGCASMGKSSCSGTKGDPPAKSSSDNTDAAHPQGS